MTLSSKPLIRILDDDPAQLASLELLLTGEGWEVLCFESAKEFFAGDLTSRPGCLILDLRMPEMTGLEVQQEMLRREYPLPIIFLTGHGDIDTAVVAVRAGAREFLQKPVVAERLLRAVATAVQEDCDQRSMPIDEMGWKARCAVLTERERQVLREVAMGKVNREIALRLGISERTVHAHRHSAYTKLGIHNVAELAPLTALIQRGRF